MSWATVSVISSWLHIQSTFMETANKGHNKHVSQQVSPGPGCNSLKGHSDDASSDTTHDQLVTGVRGASVTGRLLVSSATQRGDFTYKALVHQPSSFRLGGR